MKRVLHIVTYMGRGGLETMIMNYYRHFDRGSIQFDFLVHRDFEADYEAEIVSLGGRIYRLPRLNPFSGDYYNALDRFFEEHREYSIVHAHLDCMSAVPLKCAEKHGVPVRIAHAHNSSQVKDLKYPLKLYFKRQIPAHATQLFACSQSAGEWMFNGKPFKVVPNAIDTEKFSYHEEARRRIRNEFGIPLDALVSGHVGRFMTQKNHVFLIDIFEQVLRKKDAFLMLVGEGELMDEIRAKVSGKGFSDKVIFTGVREDVNDLLQAMDVFVFPSLFEGLPLTLIEAQAAELPCLITDNITSEIRITDLITPLSLDCSAEEWAEKSIQLAGHGSRTARREQIRKSGFDIHDNAERLQEFYLSEAKKYE